MDGILRAILIDDEKWTRKLLRNLGAWEELGVEIVAEAGDGEYALELISCLRPDLILSDIRMPRMDGLEMARILREEKIPARVIFISGYDDSRYLREAIHLQASDYLLKPVRPEELNHCLAKCAAEIRARQAETGDNTLDISDALQAGWYDRFLSLLEGVEDALLTGRADMLRDRMNHLTALAEEQEGGAVRKSVAVYYFVALTAVMRRRLGDGAQGAFRCVFDESFDFRRMMRDLRGEACALMTKREKAKTAGKRFDIDRVRAYVDEHYAEEVTLEDMAGRFFISREYLSRMFREAYGASLMDYLTARRMEKAMQLLRQGAAIREVSERTGYKDLAHFYKVFKRTYGMPPGEVTRNGNP